MRLAATWEEASDGALHRTRCLPPRGRTEATPPLLIQGSRRARMTTVLDPHLVLTPLPRTTDSAASRCFAQGGAKGGAARRPEAEGVRVTAPPGVGEEETEPAASRPDGTKQGRVRRGQKQVRGADRSVPQATCYPLPRRETHETAVDCKKEKKNKRKQPQDNQKKQNTTNVEIQRDLRTICGWTGGGKYCFCLFLYLGISLFLRK